ncbi:MAG: VanZ family protein [Bacteroidetes bacterium]|nr:VanZ family protein [Bacteroidota bacterium]
MANKEHDFCHLSVVQRAIVAGALAVGFLIFLLLGVGVVAGLLGVLLAAVVANLLTADYVPQRYRIALAIVVAVVDESRQAAAAERTGALSDVALDIGGAASALALTVWRLGNARAGRLGSLRK